MVNKGLILLVSLAILSIANFQNNSTNTANHLDTNNEILKLDHNNFNQLLEKNEFALIYFYSTNNENSNKLDKVYNEAYKTLVAGEKLNVIFTIIDGSENPEIVERLEVLKYPTIFLFRRLGNEYIRFHGKEKNLEKLLKFVRKQINEKYNWKEIKNIAEFDKKSDFKNVLLFLGNKEKYRK